MGSTIAIGAGAGFVSALLFAVVTTLNPLSFVLYLVSPLPILLAALGWNHRAGISAALLGSLCIGLAFAPSAGLVFALSVGLPAWWYAYLTLLAKTDEKGAEWYPLGRLLAWIAIVSASLTVLGALVLGGGSYETFVKSFERAARMLEEVNPGMFAGTPGEQRDGEIASVGALVASVAPPLSAAVSVLTSAALLYLAGRIVLASGRLPRPWPVIAQAKLPQQAAIVLAVSIGLGVLLEGFPELTAWSVAAALMMAYCLQGLAVIHVLTQGVSGRGGILAGVYITFFVLPGWPVALYAMVGLADVFVDLRARRQRAGPPAPPLA